MYCPSRPNLLHGAAIEREMLWQRWEPCRKYCFGVMLIMGEDKPGGMMIEGAMMFRGQDIITEFKDIPDCAPPLLGVSVCCFARVWASESAVLPRLVVETFDMSEIDISSAGEKKKLEAYLSWGEYGTDKDLPGPCLDGKEFK